jgi:hypothetical protein
MQLSYAVNPTLGIPGQILKTGRAVTVRSYIANGVVRPGQYVELGAGETCKHPETNAPTAAERGGVVILQAYSTDENGEYPDKSVVDVLVEGDIVVETESAVTEHGAAFVRFSAAGVEENGAFRVDADGSDAAAIPGLYFRSAGTLVHLEVNHSAA